MITIMQRNIMKTIVIEQDMTPLPLGDQRHLWLCYQVEGYTEEIDLAERLRMVYTRDDGQEVFMSHAWRRLFEIQALLVHEFILEFFSTCRIGSEMGLDVAGLHTTEDMAEDEFGAYWLGSEREPEKVTVIDIFYLRSMDRGAANVLYLLAQYLFRHVEWRKSGARLSGGQFIRRFAHHLGLVKSITDIEQPKTLKDIQSLNGKLAALSRFLSKGAERSLPFFKVLKSCTDKKNIQWTQEAAAALQEMKKFVETLPTLTAPIHGEVLMMYLAASTESINAALFARREKGQVPIYFVSRVLQGAELNYPALEKLILALVHAARRLRRYFQAHTVAVLTNSSIKQALTKPKKSGRVAKWAIELGEHDIMFQTRDDSNKETPKDFLIEAPPEDNRKEVERKTDTKLEETKLSCEWKLYTDGASSSDGSGAGLMLIDPEGKEYTYALRFKFETTNNEAEYEALLAGLRIAQEMEIVNLAIFVDSQLLVNQVKGIYAAKQPAIREYLQRTKETLRRFRSYTIEHIRRNQNKKADALSKLASMTFEHLTKEVLVEVLARMSIEEKEVLQVETKEEESGDGPHLEYLLSGCCDQKRPKESRKTELRALYKFLLFQYGATFNGGQNHKARILLAVNAHRRLKNNSTLTPINGPMRIEILGSSHRTIHQMDRSKASDHFESIIAKDGRGRAKEVTKRKESKEVGTVEEEFSFGFTKEASIGGDIGLETYVEDKVAL
ncbi:reverse transcriptase domain-containing protein [Tanacetum coccineum]